MNKPISWWRKVIWTDESPFVLRHNRRGYVIIRKSRKNTSHLPFIGKTALLSMTFTSHGAGDFHRIVGIMDQHIYRQILIDHMVPSAERLFPDGDFIFQHDNDPKHTARLVKEYLANTGWMLIIHSTRSIVAPYRLYILCIFSTREIKQFIKMMNNSTGSSNQLIWRARFKILVYFSYMILYEVK